MLTHSPTSNPVIVRSSVHNVRIERLWRDTFRCVLSLFYQLFYFMEEDGKLDPLSENDLYCLHFVYIPRITRALDAFKHGWNNHAITTEHCMTPLQMFTSGSLLQGIQLDSFDGDVDSALEMDASGVVVPSISSPLTTSQENELKSLINPLQDSSNYGIELYEHVQQFVLSKTML